MDYNLQLNNYAKLIVKVGVNIRSGQTLVVNSSLEAAELTRLIVKHAYEAGALLVKVNWSDDTITRMRYDLAPDESFLVEPKWLAAEMEELVAGDAAVVSIVTSPPDLLDGVPQERIVNYQKTYSNTMAKYRHAVQTHKFSWCLAAAPSPAWAAKVFPGEHADTQLRKLWDAIFSAVRADQVDPIAAWEEHSSFLRKRADYLNAKAYKKLHYLAPGTDLTIELPKGQIWLGGAKANGQGCSFVANIPTEEVFTAPLATGVNGIVSSTKPLSYGGTIIDRFSLTFENGRIVHAQAEQGEDTLNNLIAMDEGSHYLGEVALVPHQSPISDSNILYYKTLFDENSSNHLAIGSAYASNLEGGKQMSQEELKAAGLNTSMVHVDFMVGSAEMDIFGVTEDGSREPIFIKGNWAF
ncbi:aminopeptidase [Paenibacillus sp. GCM10023252]|uniref:aminopeptidase n=1 Tax=Paenibacillus sp. GCM10023252 TaxID=3252649 RepID=UPI00360A4B2A